MHGDLASVLAAVTCGVFATVAEPVTVAPLRRLAAINTSNDRPSHTCRHRDGVAPTARRWLPSPAGGHD